MSAYVVDNKTINRIVTTIRSDKSKRYPIYGQLWRLFGEPETTQDFDDLGVELLAMNQDAVMQRYPDCDATNLPGPVDPPPYSFSYEPTIHLRAYKDMACLLYQCRNVPDTELYNKLSEARNIMARAIVESSEEYEKAPW